MTARSSANKSISFRKFKPYFLNKMRLLRPQLIMNSILSLLSYPLLTIILSAYLDNESKLEPDPEAEATLQSLLTMSVIVCILCLLGLFIFTYVTTLKSFRYLYDKTAVDMDYSLPVNHNTRFFGDLAAVSVSSLLPHLLAILIAIIPVSTMNWQAAFAIRQDAAAISIQLMFTGLFACVMQMAIDLLILSFCGKKAEARLYPAATNIAIPIIHALCAITIASGVYGANSSYVDISGICITSPIGMLFRTFNVLMSDYTNVLPICLPEYIIPAAIITLCLFVAAYFLIKIRRTERVGNSYVFKAMDIIIPGVVIFAIALPICYIIFIDCKTYQSAVGAWTAGMIISTFIVYLIMMLISGQDFRKFPLTLAKWAGTTAVCVGISAILAFSNGFGMAEYIPSSSDIAKVSLTMNNIVHSDEIDRDYYFGDASSDTEIAVVTDIHKRILEVHPDDGNNTIAIYYTLKNGSTVSRRYYVEGSLYDELLEIAVTPETYYHQITSYISGSDMIRRVSSIEQSYSTPLPTEKLLEALRSDCEAVTIDLIYNESPKYCGVELYIQSADSNHMYYYLQIYDWMEDTAALFESLGFDLTFMTYEEHEAAYEEQEAAYSTSVVPE